MSYGIKNSLLAWWILVILTIFLWCRNYKYDRMISALAFTIALIQLTEYGIFNNMNIKQGGKLLFMLIWLIILILSLSTLVFTKNIVSLGWTIIVSILFLIICVHVLLNRLTDVPIVNNNKIEYGYIIDDIYWLYIACFIIPFIILVYHFGIDFYLMILISYIVTSMLIIYFIFGQKLFLSMWIYSLIGLVFMSWIIGMYPS